jgi:hypothetical protein
LGWQPSGSHRRRLPEKKKKFITSDTRADMDEHNSYLIEMRGQLNEDDLNEFSPFELKLVRVEAASTTFLVSVDPSGLVGLIRCLHGRGLVLLSLNPEFKNK